MGESSFIPNSFQVPNAYVDRLMSYLTPEENTVLEYAARRIFGFQKRTDHIAISQLTTGLVDSRTGEPLDKGTGLGIEAVRKALSCLVQYRVIERLNEKPSPLGDEYRLQLDADLVDWNGLKEREAARHETGRARVEKALAARGLLPPTGTGQEEDRPVMSDMTGHVGQNATPHVPQNATPHVGQKHNNQRNPEKTSGVVSSKQRARDPRLDHAAIQLVRDTLHFYPPKASWDAVILALGESPDTKKFEEVASEWGLRGGSPRNLKKMLEWYKHGIPTPAPGPAAPKYETSQERKLRQLDEMKERVRNGATR